MFGKLQHRHTFMLQWWLYCCCCCCFAICLTWIFWGKNRCYRQLSGWFVQILATGYYDDKRLKTYFSLTSKKPFSTYILLKILSTHFRNYDKSIHGLKKKIVPKTKKINSTKNQTELKYVFFFSQALKRKKIQNELFLSNRNIWHKHWMFYDLNQCKKIFLSLKS